MEKRIMERLTLILASSMALLASPARGQSIVYVDDSAPPGGDGSSWSTAFNNLQNALLPVPPNPTQVRVAQGLYHPAAPTGSRFASFAMTPGLELLGGYAGVGTPNPNDRNVTLFVSVLSGDLKGDDGPNFTNYGENSFHVVTSDTNPAGFTIDGFVIRAGNSNDGTPGAGLSILKSSPCVVNQCTFLANSSGFRGGGVYMQNASVEISKSTFAGNRASTDGGAIATMGGGTVLTLSDCVIDSNEADFGGGIALISSFASIDRCTISNNIAEGNGGGIAVYLLSQMSIGTSMIRDNIASDGLAVQLENEVMATIINSALIDNDSLTPQIGAALLSNGSSFKVVNCTIASVHQATTSGIRAMGFPKGPSAPAEPLLKNSIIYNPVNLPPISDMGSIKIVVAQCHVSGGWPGVGNSATDPLFTNPSNGDYTLAPGSSCIDSGDKSAYPPGMPLDLAGKLRFKDDPGTCDTGPGAKPHIDRGAYEFQGLSPKCYADCDANCQLEVDDFICFQTNFAIGLPSADCDADGLLSVDDFICFQTIFAIGC
jgi:predicted outer membrane repeat protein